MKILITTDWYAPTVNGVVTSVLNLEGRLRDMGHEVKILTLSEKIRSYKTEYTYYVKSLAAPIYPEARVGFIKHRYYKEIIDWKPDIIHSQCEFSTYLMALIIAHKLNIPIVHTYHTVYEEYTHYFCPSETLGKVVVAVLTKKLLNLPNAIIVPTKKVKELLLGYGVDKDIYVLPTGIDLSKYERDYTEEEIDAVKTKYDIPKNNKIMIFLGRLAKEKNISELLKFYKKLNRDDLTFLIVGGGPYFKELKKEADEICEGRSVIFTDMVPPEEVSVYYKTADFFVSASTSETQGITYIEALACGLPALCKKDPCIEEVVFNDINGYQYTSYEEFADFANKLCDDNKFREKLSVNSHKTAHEFSTVSFAEKAFDIYSDVLEKTTDNLFAKDE